MSKHETPKSNASDSKRRLIVGAGEILWDVFPSGAKFGGAPANFACCAAALAKENYSVAMLSAVGDDPLGLEALAILRSRNVIVDWVPRLPSATGRVDVTVDTHGHPSYRFAPDTAWDQLGVDDSLSDLVQQTAAVCFGTLGQRSKQSQHAIQTYLRALPKETLRIFDINLRTPFWNEEVILQSLPLANVLKLNDEELPIVAKLHDLEGSDEAALAFLAKKYNYRLVALTRGGEGSLLLDPVYGFSELSGEAVTVVDTVGAGDSFTACLAVSLLQDVSLDAMHRWASAVSAFVCTQAGATPELPHHLRDWRTI